MEEVLEDRRSMVFENLLYDPGSVWSIRLGYWPRPGRPGASVPLPRGRFVFHFRERTHTHVARTSCYGSNSNIQMLRGKHLCTRQFFGMSGSFGIGSEKIPRLSTPPRGSSGCGGSARLVGIPDGVPWLAAHRPHVPHGREYNLGIYFTYRASIAARPKK